MEIYTIGHSSHSKEFFEKMLKDYSIEVLVDVRAFPGSWKWPQFSKDIFPKWLEAGANRRILKNTLTPGGIAVLSIIMPIIH